MYLSSYLFGILLGTASFQGLAAADHAARNLSFPPNLKPFPRPLHHALKNNGSVQFYGCYGPAPGLRYLTAQDGMIALGEFAKSQEFYKTVTWSSGTLLAEWRTTSIYLVKVGTGWDYFSRYEAAVQAMDVLWQCVMFLPEPYGGSVPVGFRDIFRLVVQSKGRLVQ